MTNPKFNDIGQYRDVESINYYNILKEAGKDENEIIEILQAKSRDNSRTPMQWEDTEHAGFTKVTPWISVPDNAKVINAEHALKDRDSIFHHYQKLIFLRKKHDIIAYGDYQEILGDHDQLFAYVRSHKDEKLLVINNFYAKKRPSRFQMIWTYSDTTQSSCSQTISIRKNFQVILSFVPMNRLPIC